MKASTSRHFAVITWKEDTDHELAGRLAVGVMKTCGHDDPRCPRITADVLHRDGSVDDAWCEAEGWDGECQLLDPIVCTCAR